eukprot:775125-Karenia_brevis.AAC.1
MQRHAQPNHWSAYEYQWMYVDNYLAEMYYNTAQRVTERYGNLRESNKHSMIEPTQVTCPCITVDNYLTKMYYNTTQSTTHKHGNVPRGTHVYLRGTYKDQKFVSMPSLYQRREDHSNKDTPVGSISDNE